MRERTKEEEVNNKKKGRKEPTHLSCNTVKKYNNKSETSFRNATSQYLHLAIRHHIFTFSMTHATLHSFLVGSNNFFAFWYHHNKFTYSKKYVAVKHITSRTIVFDSVIKYRP